MSSHAAVSCPLFAAQGPDALYDVDSGPKASLQKSIVTSPLRYRNMRAGIGRVKAFQYETPAHLGPGESFLPVLAG